MSRLLECVGTNTGLTNHDFQPGGTIIHAVTRSVKRKTPESPVHHYEERIAEGAITQQELARVVKERDALAHELREIQRVARTYNQPERKDSWKWLNEVGDIASKALAKLASGELRKLSA